MFKGFHIAASGMAAQRHRVNLVGSNLANASTTRTEEGGPYQRKEAVFRTSMPEVDLDKPGDVASAALRGVYVDSVHTDPSPGPLIYDPGHPDADDDGNVRLPNVNPMEEMVDLITASRSFEANVEAFQTLRDMMNRAMDIGR